MWRCRDCGEFEIDYAPLSCGMIRKAERTRCDGRYVANAGAVRLIEVKCVLLQAGLLILKGKNRSTPVVVRGDPGTIPIIAPEE